MFPGQGSQAVGMGAGLAAVSPAAAAVFAAADEALGEPLSRLAWEGPAETLNLTENAQPALLATSIAYLAALRERWAERAAEGGPGAPDPVIVAGHSMGQYSAFVAAGALSLADAVRLVRERGRLMQASGAGREGRMAALIGLDDSRLPELVAQASAHGTFGVANRNAPGQVVVSGDRAAVEASLELARGLGARRAIELPVSVAAHSPLMAEAAREMADVLASVDFHDPHPGGPGQRRCPADPDGRRGPGRAGRAPDRRGRLDPGGRDDGRRRGRDIHRDRPRPRPDRPDQPDCRRCRA